MQRIIDISSDKIAIYGRQEALFLERNGVDLELGKILVELDQKEERKKIAVLNGPWGFTNLRVGCLAINLLKTLKQNQLSLFSLSKIELYQHFYERKRIPRYGLIYIGQKSNLWLWNFQENKLIKSVKKSELSTIQNQYTEFFLDQVYDKNYFEWIFSQIAYSFTSEGCQLNYEGENFLLKYEEIKFQEVEKLEPNYMIDPNVN